MANFEREEFKFPDEIEAEEKITVETEDDGDVPIVKGGPIE